MSTATSAYVAEDACCNRVSEIMRFIGLAPLICPHDRNYWVAGASELRCLLSNRKFSRWRGGRHESAERADARRKQAIRAPATCGADGPCATVAESSRSPSHV